MIVVRSRVAVILPEIPQGRRPSPWRRWSHEDEPSVDERILTIATKRELSRRSTQYSKDTTHDKTWCTTSMMHDKATWSYSWQEMMQPRATHQGKFKWGREQHRTIPGTYFEVGPDMNKHYVQVVKQQVKMHHDELHEILVKLHIKFIRFGATA